MGVHIMIRIGTVFERLGLTTRERWAWVCFDWGDQAFSTVIIGVVLPIYYVDVAGAHLDSSLATVYWSYTIALSFAFIAISSPVLGAIADHMERSRGFLALFTILGVLATGAMFFTREGDLILLSALVILANIGFRGSRLFYNSLLPGITTGETIDRVSAAGYGLGYLGGTIILLVALGLTLSPETFGLADGAAAARLALFIAACWWAIFAIPLFVYVPEPERDENGEIRGNPVSAGFRRLYGTYQEVRSYREAFIFLVAFWFYANGVLGIISLAAAYATDIGISETNVMIAFVLVQTLGIPCAFAFGQLADYFSTKTALYGGLGVYILVSFGAMGIETFWHFLILATFVGMVQGGTQAISRSLFGSLTPTHKTGEFFSFFTIVGGFAAILAPMVFGVVGQVTGSTRLGIASLSFFFITGTILLRYVDVERGRRVAKEQTPSDAETDDGHDHTPAMM